MSESIDVARLRHALDAGTQGRIWIAGYSGHPRWLAGEVRDAVVRNRRGRVMTALGSPDLDGLLPWPELDEACLELLYVDRRLGKLIAEGRATYLPAHFTALPRMLARGELAVDVAALQVTPPDAEGRCHFGLSVDACPEAARAAKMVVAQFNANLPRCRGAAWIHRDEIDAAVRRDEPLQIVPSVSPSSSDMALAEEVARLVDDDTTIQFGVGALMRAVADKLASTRRGLRIHTGIVTNEVIDLHRALQSKAGADVQAPIVATMALGDQALHAFLDDNPAVELHPVSHTHAIETLTALPGLVGINSAYEIDLTGAINAEAVAGRLAGGVGGQMDFGRGAVASGGKFVIALPSTTPNGRSRIVPALPTITPVTSPRADTQWVVTEQGAVNLAPLTIDQRARALISIAHPDHRQALAADWRRLVAGEPPTERAG
jgi:acyl-CoA hydrolase